MKRIQGLMIDRANKTWDTDPERNFAEYCKSREILVVQNKTLPFVAPNRAERLQRYDFQCDFLRPAIHGTTYDIDFEIDGKGHKDKNDDWKDSVKNRSGLKVIHIDGELVKKKWWGELDRALNAAILSKEPTVRIRLSGVLCQNLFSHRLWARKC